MCNCNCSKTTSSDEAASAYSFDCATCITSQKIIVDRDIESSPIMHKYTLLGRLGKSSMTKTLTRVADDRLPKRAAELREEGRRRRGRPMLTWDDCVKRDVRNAGGDEGGQC